MTYKAIFTDEFLSYFRLDDNGKTPVLTDKTGLTRAVTLEAEKHGEWVKTYEYDNDSPVQCSDCLMEFDYIDGIGHLTDKELPNFCPNCGADMRGKQNGISSNEM